MNNLLRREIENLLLLTHDHGRSKIVHQVQHVDLGSIYKIFHFFNVFRYHVIHHWKQFFDVIFIEEWSISFPLLLPYFYSWNKQVWTVAKQNSVYTYIFLFIGLKKSFVGIDLWSIFFIICLYEHEFCSEIFWRILFAWLFAPS